MSKTGNVSHSLGPLRSALVYLLRKLMGALNLRRGFSRISKNPLVDALFQGCRSMTATLENGLKMVVNPQDFDGRVLVVFGVSDRSVLDAVKQLSRRGDVFLDIGANYGEIGLLARDIVGETGHVHLFEPQNDICDRIEDALGALPDRSRRQVEVHRYGLMDKNDVLEFYVGDNHSGAGSFLKTSSAHSTNSRKFEVRNVSEVLAPVVGTRPTSIKIDIEGAEKFILPWLLENVRYRYIVMEAKRDTEELFDIVSSRSGLVYGLRRNLFSTRLERVDSIGKSNGIFDWLVVRKELIAEPPRSTTLRNLAAQLDRHDPD